MRFNWPGRGWEKSNVTTMGMRPPLLLVGEWHLSLLLLLLAPEGLLALLLAGGLLVILWMQDRLTVDLGDAWRPLVLRPVGDHVLEQLGGPPIVLRRHLDDVLVGDGEGVVAHLHVGVLVGRQIAPRPPLELCQHDGAVLL